MKDGYLTLEEAVREIRGAMDKKLSKGNSQVSALSQGNGRNHS